MTVAEDRAARLRRAIVRRKGTRANAPGLAPRPTDRPAQLGPLQRALWLAHRVDPRSAAYNLASTFQVTGDLEMDRLVAALAQVVARHRILRSTYQREGDDVVQCVHPTAEPEIEISKVPVGQGRAVGTAVARRPFDLERGPLLRLGWVEEGDSGVRLLVLVMHHILADERTLGLLWQELAVAYADRPLKPAPALQYDDYVHDALARPPAARAADLEFWRKRLTPTPDTLRLPFETSGAVVAADSTAITANLGAWREKPLNGDAQHQLRRLAAESEATPFAVYVFAFRLLLQRYGVARNVAFATPVSTRSAATADMIGYFTNPLVVTGGIRERASVIDALGAFGARLQETLTHAALPLHDLIEALAPARHGRHPIFQVMFVYQELSTPPQLAACQLAPVTLDLGAAKFDLTLFVTETPTGTTIAVEYRRERFEDVWMEQLLEHYATLVRHLPLAPAVAVAAVSHLSEDERTRLRAWSHGAGSQDATPSGGTPDLLPDQIDRHVKHTPGTVAVVLGDTSLSYTALGARADALADRLVAAGVGPGDRVVLFMERAPDMIASILGIHRTAAAYVPLDPAYPEARKHDVLKDAEVSAVLTTADLQPRLPSGPWPVVVADDAATLSPSTVRPALVGTLPAYLLYTSGSTGRPKGVVVDHGNLRASTAARPATYGAAPRRFLLIPSIAFDSSVAGLFWILGSGGTLVLPKTEEARDPRRLARLVRDHKVTSLLCVPSLYAEMLNHGSADLAGLVLAIVAGEACPSTLVAAHFECLPQTRLFNEYGPTEATVWATVHEMSRADGQRRVAIGRPIEGVRLEVVDVHGRLVAPGVPGDLLVHGPTVAGGYWRRPALTADRFFASDNGTRGYRTGDRAAWTLDGRLQFLGRRDDQIQLRGFRIESGEVEAALLARPGVEAAAVVVRDELLVAFIRGKVSENWRSALARRLPAPMVPSRLVALPALPHLANGKVDRQALVQMPLSTDQGANADQRATRLPVLDAPLQALVSLWRGLLGRADLGPDANFFELGGHSLLAVEMIAAIERDFEVSLAVSDVFEHPTPKALAQRIARRDDGHAVPYQHLFPLQPQGDGAPFIVAVPHFFSQMFSTRFRGERPVYGLRGVSLRPEGNRGRWPTLTDLAEELVGEILRRFPGQNGYHVAGYSFGCSMAIETVRLLEARGVPVHGLYLIAPMAADFHQWGPFRFQIPSLRGPLRELSSDQVLGRWLATHHPFRRRFWALLRQRLLVDSWRRLLCRLGGACRRLGLPLDESMLYADVRLERFRLHADYRPGELRTRVVLFDAPNNPTHAAATWRPYFRGSFTAIDTPDPHHGEAETEAARQVILRHLLDLESTTREDPPTC